MIIEIILSVVGTAFVVLVVILTMSLKKLNQVLKKTDHTLSDIRSLINEASDPTIELIEHTNDLVMDIKKNQKG